MQKKPFIFFSLSLCFLIALFLLKYQNNLSIVIQYNNSVQTGKKLSEKFCSSCHLTPKPEHLTRNTWPIVLAWMGQYLGLKPQKSNYALPVNPNFKPPEKPTISKSDWEKLQNYFLNNAPEKIQHEQETNYIQLTKIFNINEIYLNTKIPLVTLVKIDPRAHEIYLGEAKNPSLYKFNSTGQILEKIQIPGIPTDLKFEGNSLYLLLTKMLLPNENADGNLWIYQKNDLSKKTAIINKLIRPVSFDMGDVNNDKKPDFILNEFGYHKGRLSLAISNGSSYQKKALTTQPGALDSFMEIKNGTIMIKTLFAQANETVNEYSINSENKIVEKILFSEKNN